jgi:flagellar basal-body rod protein FlgB
MDETSTILKTLLDGCSLRHRVLANNLANSSTPGFSRKDVSFKSALSQAVQSGNAAKLKSVKPKVFTDTVSPRREDGNSVSSRKELGLMAENSLLYEVSAKALSTKFKGLHKAIRGK